MPEGEMKEASAPQEDVAAHNVPATTVRAANMGTIYVSAAQMAVGSIDVRLFLGDMMPTEDGKGLAVTQRLCVIMSPEYARVVANSIIEGLKNYEAQFGKIRDLAVTGLRQV